MESQLSYALAIRAKWSARSCAGSAPLVPSAGATAVAVARALVVRSGTLSSYPRSRAHSMTQCSWARKSAMSRLGEAKPILVAQCAGPGGEAVGDVADHRNREPRPGGSADPAFACDRNYQLVECVRVPGPLLGVRHQGVLQVGRVRSESPVQWVGSAESPASRIPPPRFARIATLDRSSDL